MNPNRPAPQSAKYATKSNQVEVSDDDAAANRTQHVNQKPRN
jgi:hypothetical protein